MTAPPRPRVEMEAPRPRIEREELPAARLEAEPVEPLAAPPRTGAAALVLAGAATLLLGFLGFAAANFVADQFARADWLGWLTLLVSACGFGLLGAGLWRELRGLLALGSVDRLRSDLASGEPARIQDAARRWTAGLPEAEPVALAVRSANDPDALVPALARAMDRGITVISWDSGVAPEGREMHLSPSSNALIGQTIIRLAADHLPEGGQVAVLSATSTSTTPRSWA